MLSVNPTTVPVYGTGSADASTLLVQETGYSGTFTEQDTCAGTATISTTSANGPSATYTVTGVAAGSCSATFEDSFAQQTTASIVVTTNGFTVQSRPRKGS